MTIKLSITRELPIPEAVLEEKIHAYQKKNSYRIIEKGSGFVSFVDDEFSDRRTSRRDYHNRIGKGKFDYHASENGSFVRLIYLTDVLYPFLAIMVFIALGIHVDSFAPILLSTILILPVAYRIVNLNDTVFQEIEES